jgi:hypothetical protein
MSEQINLENEEEKLVKDVEEEPIDTVVDKEASVVLEEAEEEAEEEELPKKVITNKPDEVLLQLGDIILIVNPSNEILNNNIFLIEYIDPTKIKLINVDTFEKTALQITSNGVIGDGSIQSIKVISSNSESGYARQNDLLPGTWINIYFGGEIPTIITGEITNIEEDMIEIRTTDGDTLFINFNYQGIPEDLPIETFEIRPAIKTKEEKPVDVEELLDLEEGEEGEEGEEEGVFIPKKTVKEQVKRMIFDIDELELGDIVKVEEYVNIDKDKYRYNIETQTNDLLEELISGIPNIKRTNNVLNSIHIMITRFIQLRQIASTFDLNKNINGIIKKTSDDKPLAEYLSGFKNTLYWIMMVAKNVKKIYPENAAEAGKKMEDYETINETEDLLELSSLFSNKKYDKLKKDSRQTRHSSFTYGQFDKYMTPFYSLNPDSVNDVFTQPNGIIIEGNVETDINAIVDNLGDLYSTVVSSSEITNRRFVIQRYNLGLDKLHATNLKGQKMVAHRVKLTENDPISINSIITLPESTVRFSQINLPGSNLLVKANLNMHFLNYWQLLKQKTSLTHISIDGLDNEIEYDDTNFVDNIKQYMLDLSEYEKPSELTNLDIYKIFLHTIIPKIRVLFTLVKKYIKGRLSMVDVINYLEPFLIYPIDLTYMQYKDINNFIYQKIKEYNSLFKESTIAFSSIKYIRNPGEKQKKDERYAFSNPLFGLINYDYSSENNTLQREVLEDYDIADPGSIKECGSEFLKRITMADYGNLYNTAVALTNIHLMFPADLMSVFDADKDNLKTIIEKDKTGDKCGSYIIAKKYYTLEALIEDNEKVVYFDKQFDSTNYEIVEEKYKKERDSLSKEEFIIYLTDKLKKDTKIDEHTAEYMAETLVNQVKKVKEGDYALLLTMTEGEQPDQLEYYIRSNDIWVLDKDIDPNLFLTNDDILCNINYNCIYNPKEKGEDKCESTELSKDSLVNNALKDILDQFDKNYKMSKEELNTYINKHLTYFKTIFDRIKNLKRKQFFKYNNQYYDLGLTISDEIKERVVSPYIKLRDLIMGQNDFVKKQTDIIRFVSIYCREGNPEIPNIHDGEMEDEWWLYCKKTDTKLLPKFVYILANTFVTKNSQYEDVLNELKKSIGKRSDNGDAWVDKHSGEVICYIDFDISEGYSEGFVDKSRNILEKDAGETIIEQRKEKKDKRLSPEGELVSNIISILSTNMGIDIEQSRDFIIKVVTELINDTRILEKEPAYRKREEEAAKKGKKMPSYATVYSSTLMFLSLGMYLIAIQTSIPSIKTRKTAPGCVRSFSGFPFEGEGDDSGLNYVACVAFKSKDTTTIPWNSLSRLNEEKIASTVKSVIVKYLIPYSEIEQKIKEKTEYLLLNPVQDIPEEYNLDKWTNFLPPLRRFNVKHLDNITSGFTEELQRNLSSGNKEQLEKLLVIDSKIIAYSLAIQESIQKLVEKKKLLLKSASQLFIDNACCNEPGSTTVTTLQYFVNENNNIEIYNNIVTSLTSLTRDIKILTESAIMLSEVDTKRIYPMITNEFSQETIYQAFITLCKFQSSVPLGEELVAFCGDKPDYLKKMDTLQEKIEKLKRDGKNYDKEKFLRLFQIVSRNNIIKMSLSTDSSSCIDSLAKVLDFLDKEDNDFIPKSLTQKLEKLVETYDVQLEEDTEDMRSLKNYLQISNDKIRKDIIQFIKARSKIGGIDLKNITNFLNELTLWKYDENVRNADIKISDDALNNNINFFKNFIALISIVFPSMIINQKLQTIDPPKYWGISRVHADDVRTMISTFYSPIENFYGNTTIKNVLTAILSRTRGIYLLSITTPTLTNIKMGEKELYSVFDKRTTTLLYEYYFLSILNEYMNLTMDLSMVTRMLVVPEKGESDLFSSDFLIERQLQFSESDAEFVGGDVIKLKQDVAKLLVSFINIMMRSKKTLNLSYNDVNDKVFKSKEAEKYDFTDRLKDMTEDQRAVDTILKHHKLGSLYSIGLSKGIKEYDPDNFDHDKIVAEKVAEIQNKLKKSGNLGADDVDINDAVEGDAADRDMDMDNEIVDIPEYELNDGDDEDPFGEIDRDYD